MADTRRGGTTSRLRQCRHSPASFLPVLKNRMARKIAEAACYTNSSFFNAYQALVEPAKVLKNNNNKKRRAKANVAVAHKR
ncbi:hypothetical protein PoB_002675700 [Plakobranchus ocellatus]|uniref:Uncharacterized protein n=1 Tax=Plakobranchus ocellatus TaxID=259542 RepID=A0AAV4A084_9GAST|nr:hypothetical protein PoB_002675700 [Plakobranchus ocellatus]